MESETSIGESKGFLDSHMGAGDISKHNSVAHLAWIVTCLAIPSKSELPSSGGQSGKRAFPKAEDGPDRNGSKSQDKGL